MKNTFYGLLVAVCGYAQISVPLTVQESLFPGSMSGVARTNEPLTVGVPLPDSAGITNTAALGLTGATAAQFTVEGTWPDGNIKWVKVRAIVPSLSAGGTTSLTLTNSGSGNFGGPNLATDNGSTITVSTNGGTCGSGTAICFMVRKANFDVIDQVQIGSTTVVASGTSQGLVVLGPNPTAAYPGNVTCSPTAGGTACTTVYSTANDSTNSTCSIEENGPAMSVLKCSADLNDGSAHVYMHTTTRLYFSQGSSKARAQVELRNADCGGGVNCNQANFTTAYKGIQGFELRLTPNISGSLTYNIGAATCGSGACTGTMSSGSNDYAYIYQADSSYLNAQSSSDYYNQCTGGGGTDNVCVAYTPLSGYAIMNSIGGTPSTQSTGTATQAVGGWGDISTAAGVGVEIGHYEMTGYGNESLEFRSGGTDVRLGMFAAENNTTSTATLTPNKPYYIPYPQYHINDVYLNFHATAPANLAGDFLKQQHYLVARAPIAWYNSSGALLYPLEDPTEESNYYNAVMGTYTPTISSSTVVPESDLGMTNQYWWGLTAYKFFNWSNGGSAMQFEVRHSEMMNFLRLGYTGSYLDAAHYYKLAAELFFPRSDFGGWSNATAGWTAYENWPTIIETGSGVANQALGMKNWTTPVNMEHDHFYGAIDYYLLSGDETIHDFIDGPAVDMFTNTVSSSNCYGRVGNCYVSTRTAGNWLMWISRLATFEASTGHASTATALLTQGNRIWTTFLKTNLCVQSGGAGNPSSCTPVQAGNSGSVAGTNFDRGVTYQFGSDAAAAYGGTCSFAPASGFPRSIDNATTGQLLQGLWEFRVAEGSGYADYNALLDYAFGIIQMLHGTSGMGGSCTAAGQHDCGEMYLDNGTGSWSANGLAYVQWIDGASACSAAYTVMNQDAFWPMYWVEHQYLGQSQTNLARQTYMELAHNIGGCGSGLRGSCGDIWHETVGRIVYILNHPNNYKLTTIMPTAFHDNADGTYNITVTVPSGATSYRVKWGARQIVDYIGYNPGTATWVGNPVTTQNWWSSTDATGIPAPTGGSQTLTVGTSPSTPGLTAANFMVKAYVGGSGGTAPPPTQTSPPTVVMAIPVNGATVSGTLTVSVTAAGSTSLTVQFKLDGANLGNAVAGAGPSYSTSWNTSTASNGSHVLSAVVTDTLGNTVLSGAVTITVSNTAGTASGTGTSLSPNTWTNLNAGGYPSAIVGYDKGVWVSSRNVYCIWGEYKAATFSESNDAMLCYSYPMNRWMLLEQVGGFHSVHRPGVGHQWGNMEYIPSIDSIWWVSDSGSNSPEAWWTMWQFDMAGLTSGVLPLMSSGGVPTRQWIAGGLTLAGYQSWDSANSKMVFFPDQTNTNGEAQICNISTMSCSASSVANGPPVDNGSDSNLRFDPDDRYTYYRGPIPYIYRLNAATGTWQQMTNASCTGADCAGGHPPTRAGAGFAYSTKDHVWLMAGGYNGGAAYTDTWEFNPAGNSGNGAWTELCNSCGYPTNTSVPGDRLVYDATDNVFLFDINGAMWAYAVSTPLQYGSTAATFAPPQTSLNRTSPPATPSNSTLQDPAFDLSVSSSGSTVYLAHVESSPPTDFSNCYVPIPYISTLAPAPGASLPSGGLAAGCAAFGVNNSQPIQPTSHVYAANVGGTLWEVHNKENIASSSAAGQAFAQTYNPGSGTWSGAPMGCFSAVCFSNNGLPKQYPTALIAGGNTPTAALIEQTSTYSPTTALYVAQYGGSSWSSLSGSTALNINASGSTVSFASIAADTTNNIAACWTEEVNSSRNIMSTTPQVQCKLWNGSAWSRMGTSSLNQAAGDWSSAPSVLNVAGTWYVAFTERSQTGNPQLYVKSYNAGLNSWSLIGSGALNINPSTGIPYHPSLATDGSSLFLAWEEQLATNQHALGYVSRCSAGVCTKIAGPIAADAANGSIEDIGLAVTSGQVNLAWTERSWGNLPQVYSTTVATSSSSKGTSACDLNGDGLVNAADVQLAINQALGLVACTNADLQQNGKCNVVDVQRIINASMGGACMTGN